MCQETMIIQQEIYQNFGASKIFIKLMVKIVSRETNVTISQQINFTGKLEEDDCATMAFIAEKYKKQF